MVYPGRKVHRTLPQFVGTAVTRPTAAQRAEFLDFVARGYPAGRSLKELAELSGRSQTAVRRALDELGIARRRRGAARMDEGCSPNGPAAM